MARTIKSMLLSVIRYNGDWTSRGELFVGAQKLGYTGNQEKLLQRAKELTEGGVLEANSRGRVQYMWYRPGLSLRTENMLKEKRATEEAQKGSSLEIGSSAQSSPKRTSREVSQEAVDEVNREARASLGYVYSPKVQAGELESGFDGALRETHTRGRLPNPYKRT